MMWRLRSRTDLERYDLYTRGSLYFLSSLEVLLAVQLVGHIEVQTPGYVMIGLLAIGIVHAAACLVLLHGTLRHRIDGGPRPRKQLIAATGATIVAAVAILAWREYLTPAGDATPGADYFGLVGVVFFFLAALSAGVSKRASAVIITAGFAGVLAVGLLVTSVDDPVSAGIFAGTLAGAAGSYRCTVWMLDVVVRLDRARTTEAELAVAEERLRFARDLHDTLGRNLSVVSLKSELAEALVSRDPQRAASEIQGVRQLAEDSLAEVRAVVRGNRVTGLDSELAGSQSLLTAAGTDCETSGSGDGLPEHVQSTLGWVVREATTNVLRHAEATSCRIDVQVDDGVAHLTMRNDGVRDRQGTRTGSGLAGLSERLEAQDGTLDAGLDGDGAFVLRASVPVERSRTMSDA